MPHLLHVLAYDHGLCLLGGCEPTYYLELFLLFQLVNVFFTFTLCIWRSRRLAMACAIVSGVELFWFLLVEIANDRIPALAAWPAALLAVVLWRLFHRPPTLYVPPPEPPPFGGPYR